MLNGGPPTAPPAHKPAPVPGYVDPAVHTHLSLLPVVTSHNADDYAHNFSVSCWSARPPCGPWWRYFLWGALFRVRRKDNFVSLGRGHSGFTPTTRLLATLCGGLRSRHLRPQVADEARHGDAAVERVGEGEGVARHGVARRALSPSTPMDYAIVRNTSVYSCRAPVCYGVWRMNTHACAARRNTHACMHISPLISRSLQYTSPRCRWLPFFFLVHSHLLLSHSAHTHQQCPPLPKASGLACCSHARQGLSETSRNKVGGSNVIYERCLSLRSLHLLVEFQKKNYYALIRIPKCGT